MDPERYAQKRIDEAIAAGDLEPTVGIGEPMKNLRNDSDWWVRAFFVREELPQKQAEFRSHVDQLLQTAIAAPELDHARDMLLSINREIGRWNDGVEASFRLEPISEIWLLEE
ncbi:MAG: DUF1992 domain-containing protein, partial [Proteobacteria bacterium]|nr:DUF1992 domain-containing protein [Pseudomonadota bacterium]